MSQDCCHTADLTVRVMSTGIGPAVMMSLNSERFEPTLRIIWSELYGSHGVLNVRDHFETADGSEISKVVTGQ